MTDELLADELQLRLEKAEGSVKEGLNQIDQQRRIVRNLARDGYDPTDAKRLLDILRNLQRATEAQCIRLRWRIAELRKSQ
jgi:hypothetical protein